MEPKTLAYSSTDRNSRLSLPVGLALAVLALLVACFVLLVVPAKRLLLAPMVGQLDPCLTRSKLPPEHMIDPAFVACNSEAGSAADVIESTLSMLGPRISRNGRYELGYTLNVPLLKFLVQRDGRWELDAPAIARMVKTIAQSPRHVILYLFSTHFSVDAPIEPMLAADPANLAITPRGQLSKDKHYGMDVYPWSIARTDNSLTQARLRVIEAFVKALCEQPRNVRARLAGVTLLGEVHHLFPRFEAGMGFDGDYVVSDYSPTSVRDFRQFLKERFHGVAELNAALGGAQFENFDVVDPPSKNIRRERLRHFWEHLDAFAQGYLPVQGWLAPHPDLTGWVYIYLNGAFVGKAYAGLGRQDVRDARPMLGTADVGWRHNLDFRALKPGIYEVAAMAEARLGRSFLLGKREIVVLDRRQSSPSRMPAQELPPHTSQTEDARGAFDQPGNLTDYYYNPLAELWHEFRGQQVLRYVRFIEKPLQQSCLADVPRYIHQLFPYPNPSWDAGKYAVDASLRVTGDLRLGVSLYGEATYGDSFLGWRHADLQRTMYGVTEFHPLRAMSPSELTGVFDRLHENGAQFLSFFLEGRGPVNRAYDPKDPTIPFFGENNRQHSSDELYRSLSVLLRAP